MDLASNAVGSQQQTGIPLEGKSHGKFFTIAVQLTIAAFTVSLIWFSFIFYPNVVDNFKGVGLPQTQVITSAAAFGEFPIETEQYRVTYEERSNTYYVFVEGDNLAVFGDNKNRATLAIKSALSLQNVCVLNIIYASVAKLEVPQELKRPASCS